MIAFALSAALAAAGPPTAAPKFDRACMDEYGRNLCDSELRADIRAKFGVPEAEALAAQDVSGVRVFLVDGYSNDRPLVSVLRTGEAEPTLEVRVAGLGDKPMILSATPWRWAVAQTLAKTAAAEPETAPSRPPVSQTGNALTVCLHAWVVVVEVIDEGKVTRRIRNACDDGAIFEGAYSLTTMALYAAPFCGELQLNAYGGDSSRLTDCALISGRERLSAVAVINRFKSGTLVRDEQISQAVLEDLFAPDAILTQDQEPDVLGPPAISARWRAVFHGKDRIRFLSISGVAGEPGGVRVTGTIKTFRSESGRRVLQGEAPFTQDWRLVNRSWRIARWHIGALQRPTK